MELKNIVGFKAVDKDGNEQNVTVDEIVDMVATRMVSALSETSDLSEISTFATAAATGNDVYENELPTVTDASNVRVLQSNGNAAQMTMQSLATKLGELMNNLNLFPFMNKGILTETDDLNNVLKSGIYEISAPTTGVLNGKGIKYGILVMFSASQRIQLLGNGLYGNAYFRTGRDNGTWYDWVSIY